MKLNKSPAAATSTPAAPPSGASRAKFDKVAEANPTNRQDNITVGHYLGRLNTLAGFTGFKAGPGIVGEMTIVHVFPDSQHAINNQSKQPIPSNYVGQEVSDVILESNVAYADRVRSIIDAAAGTTQDDWNAKRGKLVDEAIDPSNPLGGVVVEIVARTVTKEKAREKPADQLITGQDTYVKMDYRMCSFSKAKSLLSPENLAKFFPDIETQIAAETSN